jgi:signal transduction histidine kinase
VTEAHLRALQATREERLQAMGLMATELAHEIRNPLGSLALFAGMLVEDLKDQPPQSELAVRIQESVQRLNTLVTNTLTFSRDLVPKPEKLDLFCFWEEARAAVRFPESITWHNRIPTEATWVGDPSLLRQVVTNVIQNAARAMAEHPAAQFLVTAAEEWVEGTRHWHITAEDNGCGIAPEALARVFDPFFSTFEGGTGLGLAVSHRIILAHGGLLHVESHENSGTKVHLRLPSAD